MNRRKIPGVLQSGHEVIPALINMMAGSKPGDVRHFRIFESVDP